MTPLAFAAGEKGMRYALPNARVMVHQPSASFYGQAVDIARHAQEIVKLKRRLNEIYKLATQQHASRRSHGDSVFLRR